MKTKARMLSAKNVNLLFDHILDGFKGSYAGIQQLKADNEVHQMSEAELIELLEKNSQRLIDRIKEFKLGQRLVSIFFALLLGYMQMTGEDLEMRRTARRSGRRKNESEQISK